jgi:hypothetical protein
MAHAVQIKTSMQLHKLTFTVGLSRPRGLASRASYFPTEETELDKMTADSDNLAGSSRGGLLHKEELGGGGGRKDVYRVHCGFANQ